MKSFLGKHQERLLVTMGLVLFAVLIAYFIWSGITLAGILAKAISPPDARGDTTQFDIQGAEGLGITVTE